LGPDALPQRNVKAPLFSRRFIEQMSKTRSRVQTTAVKDLNLQDLIEQYIANDSMSLLGATQCQEVEATFCTTHTSNQPSIAAGQQQIKGLLARAAHARVKSTQAHAAVGAQTIRFLNPQCPVQPILTPVFATAQHSSVPALSLPLTAKASMRALKPTHQRVPSGISPTPERKELPAKITAKEKARAKSKSNSKGADNPAEGTASPRVLAQAGARDRDEDQDQDQDQDRDREKKTNPKRMASKEKTGTEVRGSTGRGERLKGAKRAEEISGQETKNQKGRVSAGAQSHPKPRSQSGNTRPGSEARVIDPLHISINLNVILNKEKTRIGTPKSAANSHPTKVSLPACAQPKNPIRPQSSRGNVIHGSALRQRQDKQAEEMVSARVAQDSDGAVQLKRMYSNANLQRKATGDLEDQHKRRQLGAEAIDLLCRNIKDLMTPTQHSVGLKGKPILQSPKATDLTQPRAIPKERARHTAKQSPKAAHRLASPRNDFIVPTGRHGSVQSTNARRQCLI
jgi:hypothetical protein